MAPPRDYLRSLPPELRHCVYAYLLCDDEDGTGGVRQKHGIRIKGPSDEDLPAILALP